MDDVLKIKLKNLLTNTSTASLGTSKEDQPYVSLVSFAMNDKLNEIYIHISQLARHTKNIESNNKVSLMIYEEGIPGINPQTLARVTILGEVNMIEKDSQLYAHAKKAYLNKNNFAEMYFTLGDFNLFRIEIIQARFVAGFAQTFNLTNTSFSSLLNI